MNPSFTDFSDDHFKSANLCLVDFAEKVDEFDQVKFFEGSRMTLKGCKGTYNYLITGDVVGT